MMLADQGAEVIKVEPFTGDYVRFNAPFHPDDTERAYSGYFASVNRNKKSIAVDLKTEEGRDIVIKLCRDADAVVENYASESWIGWAFRSTSSEPRTRASSTPAFVASAIRRPDAAPMQTGRLTMSSPRRSVA
jgi:hypothetical protein